MNKLVIAFIALIATAVSAMAQDEYLIRPGDTLQVEVLEDPSLNRSVLVLPSGQFSFPFAGTVQAGGKSVGSIRSTLSSALASNFTSAPNVFVTVASLGQRVSTGTGGKIDVYFLGEVAKPGIVSLDRGTTFLQALAASGGLTSFAADKRIQLRRVSKTGQSSMYEINYRAIMNGAALDRDVVLSDGDVIVVPERRLFE